KDAEWPAVSRSGDRLAYQQITGNPNVWGVALSGPGAAAGPPRRVTVSTQFDGAPQYSPDGKRIAFESDRTGMKGIWVRDADGSNATLLFARSGTSCGSPSWSPDGQRIAFDSIVAGNVDIYVMRSGGGNPIRLTTDVAADERPSW